MRKKNGFFYFMIEYKRLEEGKGCKFSDLGEVAPLAGKIWKKMNDTQREPYVKLAAQRPIQQKAIESNRNREQSRYSTSTNCEVKHGTMEKAEVIKSSLQQRLLRAELADGLDKEEFYIVSMIYFCRNSQGTYVPAELGMVKFNLEYGVKEQLHILINPGTLPLGFALEAQRHAGNSHGLPLPPNALGETDYVEITNKVLTFLKVKEKIPPLFTDAKDIPIVKTMLSDILEKHIKGKTLYVSSLAELFFHMKQGAEYHMMSMSNFPSVEAAQNIIDEDTFSYTPNISCEYHESNDLIMECALSNCIRWAYTIANNCCLEMDIELIPGKHIPIDWKPHTAETFVEDVIILNDELHSDKSDISYSTVRKPLRYEERYNYSEPGCSGVDRKRESAADKPDLHEIPKNPTAVKAESLYDTIDSVESDLSDSKVEKPLRYEDRYNDSEPGCSGVDRKRESAADKPDLHEMSKNPTAIKAEPLDDTIDSVEPDMSDSKVQKPLRYEDRYNDSEPGCSGVDRKRESVADKPDLHDMSKNPTAMKPERLDDTIDSVEQDISDSTEQNEAQYTDSEPGCSRVDRKRESTTDIRDIYEMIKQRPAGKKETLLDVVTRWNNMVANDESDMSDSTEQNEAQYNDSETGCSGVGRQQWRGAAHAKRIGLTESQLLDENEPRRKMVAVLQPSNLYIPAGRGCAVVYEQLPPRPIGRGRGHGSEQGDRPSTNLRRGR